MLPHARDEMMALAQHSTVVSLAAVQGWNVQEWRLTPEDVERAIAAYRALLSIELDAELDQLLIDMGVDGPGPAATTDQHVKVARADAIELVAAATVISVDVAGIDDLHMPNVPKMAGQKSDSGIDVIGGDLDPDASGDIEAGERLLLVSVKPAVSKYASNMRGKLEKSVTEELPAPYIHRQLNTLHGRMIQSGADPETAKRIFYFLRETLKHPRVRVICVAAAAPAARLQPPRPASPTREDRHARCPLPNVVRTGLSDPPQGARSQWLSRTTPTRVASCAAPACRAL